MGFTLMLEFVKNWFLSTNVYNVPCLCQSEMLNSLCRDMRHTYRSPLPIEQGKMYNKMVKNGQLWDWKGGTAQRKQHW